MAAIPAIRTTTTLNPSIRVVTRDRAESKTNWFAATLAFTGLTYAFFSAGSLAGSVLAEQARRDGLTAIARAKAARSVESALMGRIDDLRSLRSIDAWAAQNGFVASDKALQTSLPTNWGRSREQ
jgi:hypothetical protein